MSALNHYEILGVDEKAEAKVIKAAHRAVEPIDPFRAAHFPKPMTLNPKKEEQIQPFSESNSLIPRKFRRIPECFNVVYHLLSDCSPKHTKIFPKSVQAVQCSPPLKGG